MTGPQYSHQPVVHRLNINMAVWEGVQAKLAAMAGLPGGVEVEDCADPPAVNSLI